MPRLPRPLLLLLALALTIGVAVAQADGLTKNDVDRVMHANINKVRRCYQKRLNDHPNLSGKVVVSFRIQKDGVVASARVESTTLNDPTVESCIVSAIQTLKFPARDSESTVSYPFLFTSGG